MLPLLLPVVRLPKQHLSLAVKPPLRPVARLPKQHPPFAAISLNLLPNSMPLRSPQAKRFTKPMLVGLVTATKAKATEPLLPLGAGPSNRFVNQVTVKLDAAAAHNWVVFHAKGEGDLSPVHPGRKPFAVSNPVFLK